MFASRLPFFHSNLSGQNIWASSKKTGELENLKKQKLSISQFAKCFVLRIDATFFGPQMLVSEVTDHNNRSKVGWANTASSMWVGTIRVGLIQEDDRCCI